MEDKIGETYLFYTTAKGIWDAVNLVYSDLDNSSLMLELRNRIRDLRQGDLDVTQYFNSLTKLWQELDFFSTCKWRDAEDAAMYRKMVEKERVYDFLGGLNKDLDDVRGRLAEMKPLPSIEEAFATVRYEETCKRVMLGNSSTFVPENSALAVRGSETQKRGELWCERCKKPNHTEKNCWKIHGKPANWVPRNAKGRGTKGLQTSQETVAARNTSGVTLTKEQMELLSNILSGNQISGTSLMAQQGSDLREDDWQC